MFRRMMVVQLKMLVRNRGSLIASLILPLFFAGLLGAATHISEDTSKLAIVNEGGPSGAGFIEVLRKDGSFDLTLLGSRGEFKDAFGRRKLDGALVVPEITDKVTISFIFDERKAAQLGRTIERVQSFVQKYNLHLAGGSEVVTIHVSPLRTTRVIPPFRYVLPTVLMFSVIFSALSFGGSQAVGYRDSGVFKRLMVTPASARLFLLSEATTRALLASVQTLLVLGVGMIIEAQDLKRGQGLLDVLPPIQVLWLIPLGVMGVLVFINLGFAAAGLAGNTEVVSSVTNLLGTVLVIISGGLLQDIFPPGVARAVQFLPIKPMLDSMLSVVTHDASPLTAAPTETAILAAWVVGTSVLALSLFRFRAPNKR